MYFYIQVILDEKRYIDWAELIAERLHEGLSNCLENKNLYMSSYLFYCLVCVRPCPGLHHAKWVDGMKIYDYHPHLQLHKCHEDFKRVHDVFAGRLIYELQGNVNKLLPDESMQLVSTYEIFFIQYP